MPAELAGCKPDRELVVDNQAMTEDQRMQEQARSNKCIPECLGKRSKDPSDMQKVDRIHALAGGSNYREQGWCNQILR